MWSIEDIILEDMEEIRIVQYMHLKNVMLNLAQAATAWPFSVATKARLVGPGQ